MFSLFCRPDERSGGRVGNKRKIRIRLDPAQYYADMRVRSPSCHSSLPSLLLPYYSVEVSHMYNDLSLYILLQWKTLQSISEAERQLIVLWSIFHCNKIYWNKSLYIWETWALWKGRSNDGMTWRWTYSHVSVVLCGIKSNTDLSLVPRTTAAPLIRPAKKRKHCQKWDWNELLDLLWNVERCLVLW